LETMQSIAYGFNVFLTPTNLLYCFLGVLMGTMVGVLPGLGPAGALSLLLPIILKAPPVAAFVMLSGVAYGAQYGGSTTSILLNIPGETASVVTCIDGYQMARQGRAGAALGISAFGSVIGGTIGVVGLMLFAPLLAGVALRFGPPEYFSLALLSLTLVTYVSKGSFTKCLMMACAGIIISTVGMDPITSRTRFTFGLVSLMDGFEIVFVAMGLFGISEVLINLDQSSTRDIFATKIRKLLPTRQDWRDSAKPIARGTVLGFLMGLIPGLGIVLATFSSYALEKKLSRHPEKFGNGAIEGVAGPETANNAASSATFVPLLSLGIPTAPSTAILLGALLILGIQPGPLLISTRPDIFWGLIASMYIGNVMCVVLNLPLVGIWVKMLEIPYSLMAAFIIVICEIGAYSVDNDATGILIMNIFGLIGYLVKRYDYAGAPLILGLVLGPMLEKSLRRSLMLSEGSPLIFVSRPLSAVFLLIVVAVLIVPLFSRKGPGKEALEMQED